MPLLITARAAHQLGQAWPQLPSCQSCRMRSCALRSLLHLSCCTGCGALQGQMVRPLREIDMWTSSHLLRRRVLPHDLLHLCVQRAAELLANKVAKRALVACVLLRRWCQAMFDSVCPMYSMLDKCMPSGCCLRSAEMAVPPILCGPTSEHQKLRAAAAVVPCAA